MHYNFNDIIIEPCLYSCHSIITNVNEEFTDFTGFTTDELIGKSLIDVGDMIRINSQIHFDNISGQYAGYIFTKLFEAREVNISFFYDKETDKQLYIFVEKINSRLDDKLIFIEQTFIDNVSCVAIFSVPNFMLLKSNQKYLDSMNCHFNKEENTVGRSVSEIVTGFVRTETEVIWNNLLETQKAFYMKEFQLDSVVRGITYWDFSLIPIFENGKMKYIFQTAIEVTETVLTKQFIERQNNIIKEQKEQLEQQLEQKNIQLMQHNKQLDDKNTQLVTILENLSEGIMVSDNKSEYIVVNAEARRLIYRPHKVIAVGNSYQNTKYFDMKGNEITRQNIPGTRALNGETIKNHTMSISCFYDITKTINQSRKIEEQKKQLEANLKIISEQNIQMNAVLDNMTEGVITTDINGKFIRANKVALLMHGFSSLDEYTNYKKIINDFEVLSLEGRPIPRADQAVAKALRGEVFNNYEVMVRRKDLNLKFIASYGGTPIYDENGKMVMAVITIRDITGYKKVDEELKSQNKLLVAVIENMYDALAVYDKKGSIILMNAECRKLYPDLNIGIKSKVVHSGFQFFDLDNNILPRENLPTNRGFKGERIRNEKIIVKNTDWIKYIEINATPIFDDENNLVSAVVSYHDISETIKDQKKIKKRQEQLLVSEKEERKILEKTLRSQEEFVANISHELKTPLNVIFATAQLFELYCSGSLDEKKNSIIKYIHSIKQNSYRLSKLINNIVDSSKIEAGFFQINLSNNNIVEVVEEIVMSVTDFVNSKGLSIIFDTDIEEKIIACDPEKIERIVLNLISNSIKFSNIGDEILVTIIGKDEFVEISVKDNGIGIEDKDLEMIFNRFKQVDKSLSRNFEGTGIGLSLVKSIVELHEGVISVESKLGEGSKFTVKLPTKMVMKENKLFNNNMKNKNESVTMEFSDII